MGAIADQVIPEAAERAIAELQAARFVVLCESRHDLTGGSLIVAADFATPDSIKFLSQHAQGLIWLCLSDERCEELGLHPLRATRDEWQPTVSINILNAAEAGESVRDKSRTIMAAIDRSKGAKDFEQPGSVFPLRARPGGVLQRAGRTEAAVDLARLAGHTPASVLSLVIDDDGAFIEGEQLERYCGERGLPLVAVADVVAYRRKIEKIVERVTSVRMPTEYGEFQVVAFQDRITDAHHVALVKGDVAGASDVLVRVQRECFGGDVFHSSACRCRDKLERALRRLAGESRGVCVYLTGSARLERHLTHDPASDAQGRPDEYGIGAQILADLGLTTIRVLTDAPREITGLQGFGLEIVEQVSLVEAGS
jgi:3,4-dihydroxy 2-butanone 4-phosphate synthase/GTP cyclohydrolase II